MTATTSSDASTAPDAVTPDDWHKTVCGSAVAPVEVNDTMQDGHISIPNGMGLYAEADGDSDVVGVPPNELTSLNWKDEYAGTPWHKHVPASLEPVPG